MSTFVVAFVTLAFLLGAFAYVAMPVGSKLRRTLVSGFFALILGTLFFGYSDMLGRPKATALEVFRTDLKDAHVLGSYLREGQGIFLWLQFPEVSEPRYYKLPWDEKTAKALQDAIEQNAKQHGGGVAMALPFERSWDKDDPQFYPLPQPKLPDKQGEEPPKELYQAPEQGV